MLSQFGEQSQHSALTFTFSSWFPTLIFTPLNFLFIFSASFIPKYPQTHFGTHAPSFPGPAVSVSNGLTFALSRHRAGQRSGQQHLPEKSGPEREQHGWHWCQDAEQSPADQHHTQVKERISTEWLFLCVGQHRLCSIWRFIFSAAHDFALQECDMGSQQHLRSRISGCGPSTWTVRARKHSKHAFCISSL